MYGKSISVPHDSVGETFSLVEIAHENAEVNFPLKSSTNNPKLRLVNYLLEPSVAYADETTSSIHHARARLCRRW